MADISHAYESKYVNKKASAVRRTRGYFDTKSIIGRDVDTKYGSYKKPSGKKYASKYYDPVARHERYLRERSSLGIGGGRSGGGGSGRGSGKSGRSSGGSGRGGRASNSAKIAQTIQKLREESSLNTDAQREAARRKIQDLRNELRKQIVKMRGVDEDTVGVNVSDIRGRIQAIREEMEKTGGDLQKWISHEKDALERRIAAVYNANGQKYTPRLQADKERASKKRNKEVNSRADAIYKSKSKKK